MPVKRQLKKDKVYVMMELLDHPKRSQLTGYRLRLTMQLDDSPYPSGFLAAEGVVLSGPLSGQSVSLYGVRLRQYHDDKVVCRCRAYDFPHHSGKGACLARFEGPFCGECNQPCELKSAKLEPWEDITNPSRETVVSKCCEARIFEDAELKKELEL